MTAHATVRVERDPPVGQAIEKGLRDMLWVDALAVLLQLRYDLVVVVSFGNVCVSVEGAHFRVLRFPKISLSVGGCLFCGSPLFRRPLPQ